MSGRLLPIMFGGHVGAHHSSTSCVYICVCETWNVLLWRVRARWCQTNRQQWKLAADGVAGLGTPGIGAWMLSDTLACPKQFGYCGTIRCSVVRTSITGLHFFCFTAKMCNNVEPLTAGIHQKNIASGRLFASRRDRTQTHSLRPPEMENVVCRHNIWRMVTREGVGDGDRGPGENGGQRRKKRRSEWRGGWLSFSRKKPFLFLLPLSIPTYV